MTPDEVRTALLKSIGKRVRITFVDGLVQSVDVGPVDDEGFLHSAGWDSARILLDSA